jgi:hypothetical protein
MHKEETQTSTLKAMENTANSVQDTSPEIIARAPTTNASSHEVEAASPSAPKPSERGEIWETVKDAGKEVLQAVVSGITTTVVLLGAAHYIRIPKFADYYNFLVEHMAGNLSADLVPLALCFCSISCILSNWNGRNFIDQWVCKPVIRLLTHIYGLASGAMLASAVLGIFITNFQIVLEHMLYPAAVYFEAAIIASSCFALTELAGHRFTKDLRDRNKFVLVLGLLLLAIFFWMMHEIN